MNYSVYGRSVKGLIEHPLEEMAIHPGKNTVTYEARLLKALLLQIQQIAKKKDDKILIQCQHQESRTLTWELKTN
ncbi:Tetratricopeptide repeat protein 30A1 [Portunus trituberculatus]|uniref:Tetratricopeptide repeat protein 30A1 n=1 Tax=Portunus trituberculatus TaxID=210409 RepID=A0A5B7CL84_PORTR|nr:Tetratricopeptide repeat protein 30A1 [Portunus trituberculatus]